MLEMNLCQALEARLARAWISRSYCGRMKPGHFVAGIFIALISAFIIPDLGSSGGILMPHVSGPGGTFLIFFIQGLQLKGGALREVWTSWRLHAACQIANFVLAPWIFVALERIFGWWIIDDSLRMGLIFLGMLPTTINSAITMVSMTGGKVASAIFNSSLSNILGVFLVPVWVNWWMTLSGQVKLDLTPVFLKLMGLILLPVVIGRMCQPLLRRTKLLPSADWLKRLSLWLIFLIVYLSFCESVTTKVWISVPPYRMLIILVVVIAGLFLVHGVVWWIGGRMAWSLGDRSVFLFCGAQKTMAAGIPLAMAMLSQSGHAIDTGLFLIPLMIYHPLQMLIGGRWMSLLMPPQQGH